MSKYDVPEGHWDAAEEQPDESEPAVKVDHHSIQIDDFRDGNGYEHGLDWLFAIEGGVVVGYTLGHYLEGRTQSDYMDTPAWEDVPGIIKRKLKESLGAGELETDLPDFYGEEGN